LSPENFFSNSCAAFGTTVEINSNSKAWLESLSRYLSLQLQEQGTGTKAGIKLYLFEVDPGNLDGKFMPPLPDQAFKEREDVLLVDRPIPAVYYTRDGQKWVNFSGYGRLWVDSARGVAAAVRSRGCGVDPLYSDILFGFNTLAGLFVKMGLYSFHASCVEVDGKGVLFTGNSGKGKTTAALALALRGCPILSDDRVLVGKNQGAYYGASISDVIKLRQESINEFFPELDLEKPFRRLYGETYYKSGWSGGTLKYTPAVPLSKVVILQKTGSSQSYYERIKPARVVGDLFPVTLNVHDPVLLGSKFSFVMDFLQQNECYRVFFGTDMNEFARQIKKLARE
jgi:hypothetical protein